MIIISCHHVVNGFETITPPTDKRKAINNEYFRRIE